mgnify:CR=1 FL=1
MTSFNDVVKWRRMFHQYPELSKYEYKTTQRIKDILTSYNIKMIDIPMETGLEAEIGQVKKCISVRTDIEASPIQRRRRTIKWKSKVFISTR